MQTLKLKHNLVLEGNKIYGRIIDVKKGGDIYRNYFNITRGEETKLGRWKLIIGRLGIGRSVSYEYHADSRAKEVFEFIMEHTYEHVVEVAKLTNKQTSMKNTLGKNVFVRTETLGKFKELMRLCKENGIANHYIWEDDFEEYEEMKNSVCDVFVSFGYRDYKEDEYIICSDTDNETEIEYDKAIEILSRGSVGNFYIKNDEFFYVNEGGVHEISKGMKVAKAMPAMEVIRTELTKWTDSDTVYGRYNVTFEDKSYTFEEFEEMLKKGRRELARWKKYLSSKK